MHGTATCRDGRCCVSCEDGDLADFMRTSIAQALESRWVDGWIIIVTNSRLRYRLTSEKTSEPEVSVQVCVVGLGDQAVARRQRYC